MKTLKVMSIIGIVYLSFCLIIILVLNKPYNSPIALAGWGILSSLYSIPFCIVTLVQSIKRSVSPEGEISDLIKLNELKEKGIITESEFDMKKTKILKNF